MNWISINTCCASMKKTIDVNLASFNSTWYYDIDFFYFGRIWQSCSNLHYFVCLFVRYGTPWICIKKIILLMSFRFGVNCLGLDTIVCQRRKNKISPLTSQQTILTKQYRIFLAFFFLNIIDSNMLGLKSKQFSSIQSKMPSNYILQIFSNLVTLERKSNCQRHLNSTASEKVFNTEIIIWIMLSTLFNYFRLLSNWIDFLWVKNIKQSVYKLRLDSDLFVYICVSISLTFGKRLWIESTYSLSTSAKNPSSSHLNVVLISLPKISFAPSGNSYAARLCYEIYRLHY